MRPYEYVPHQAHAALLILLEPSFPPANKAVTLHTGYEGGVQHKMG